jgi:Na+-transporting NADH:ubiquinone oxidoreductase subunit A
MATFNLKKGHNLKISGEPSKVLSATIFADKVYLHPKDFMGIKPKLLVKQEDSVSVGSPIFFDKLNPEIKFVSPISGMVSEIQFGERRVIERIIIKNDGSDTSLTVNPLNANDITVEVLKRVLSESGLWPNIRQRPFSKIANPNQTPRDIFISVNNTAPFAPESSFTLDGREDYFQLGLDILAKLTSGSVHLNMSDSELSPIFTDAKNVIQNKFRGEHPAGNVGVQIHHIAPIASSEDIVWYVNPQSVADIGEFFTVGKYPAYKIITVGGSSICEPTYVKITKGTSVDDILKGRLKSDINMRIISGDVLSGESRSLDQGIRFYDNSITVIPESTEREFLGWALPGLNKYSLSRTFLSALLPKKRIEFNTSMNGSHRSIISFGRWESVLPMDILPEFLVKSILANDIEEMEKLGIYECAEEDFALCSFVCQSKTDVSGIIRAGLQLAEKEG